MPHQNMRSTYANEDSVVGRSGFWQDCPILDILADPSVGYGFTDDFIITGLSGTITTIATGFNNYSLFGDSGATIAADGAVGGGVVLTEATDDESVSMTVTQHPFNITRDGGKLWFEARIKTSTIVASEQAWLCGLMDNTAQTAAVPITADGAIADINMAGFHHPEANEELFDASYKANSVTAVEVNADIGTMVAGTYFNVGMRFDPRDADGNASLEFYVDGVKQATTKTVPNATGTDFPADVRMSPVLAMTLAASAEYTMTMDWWSCYQLRV